LVPQKRLGGNLGKQEVKLENIHVSFALVLPLLSTVRGFTGEFRGTTGIWMEAGVAGAESSILMAKFNGPAFSRKD